MKIIFKLFFKPFSVIKEDKSEFLIWFIFTIVAGQVGFLANVIIRIYNGTSSICESIYLDSVSGSFFTFAIAIVASILGPMFINLINSKKQTFKTLKVFTIIGSIFFLIFSALVYAVLQSHQNDRMNNTSTLADVTQLIVYIISIFIVFYGYSILKLEDYPNNFKDLDDPLFNKIDDKAVEKIVEESDVISSDGNGVKL